MEDKLREEQRVEERWHRNQNRPQQQIAAAFNSRDRSEKTGTQLRVMFVS
jgi:hypothetical protein